MTTIPPLAELAALPYLNDSGHIPADLDGKVGVYAVFDADNLLQYVGISRDIAVSLKQHLVRVPDACFNLKVLTIESPDRSFLSAVQDAWVADQEIDRHLWEKPIDCRPLMTDSEKQLLANSANEVESGRVLKNVARRIEQEILVKLQERGLGFEIRFNPKRKEEGLLDLKIW